MVRRTVRRVEAEKEPYLLWNAFVDLIAVESYENLSSTQRLAHLVFWYDSEVQNGGHAQYFENRGTDFLGETLAALLALGLACQAEVLRKAAAAPSVARLATADRDYHLCMPTTIAGLEKHFEGNQAKYVELT